MSLFVTAFLMLLPFVALALLIVAVGFLVVQVGFAFVDRRATSAAAKVQTGSQAVELERARQLSPVPSPQTDTARVA
jgi:hypothetical protein